MDRGDSAGHGVRRGRGYYLYGVTRSRGWRARPWSGTQRCGGIRFRELEAVVEPVPFGLPELDASGLAAHQRVVGAMSCRCTILPAPPGVVFSGRRSLVRFLDDQYLALVEGLALLEGHWELRLHVERSGAEAAGGAAPDLSGLYTELRRLARAAVSFPRREGRLLSAAFLVSRPEWIDFVEQTESLGASRPDLVLDLTGPWPPYDFVKLVA